MALAPYGVSTVWSGLKYLDSQRIYWRIEHIEILDVDRQLQPVQLDHRLVPSVPETKAAHCS